MKIALSIIALIFLLPVTVTADLVNTDFLEAIGDFEKCTYVRWWSTFISPNYDFASDSIYVDPYDGGWLHAGYSNPTANNSVSDGWRRVTGVNVNPSRNAVFSLKAGILDKTNCQYFALAGLTSGTGTAAIQRNITVDADKAYRLHPGDTIVFRIDQIKMSDFSTMPSGTTVVYDLSISGADVSKALTASSATSSAEITAVIPSGLSYITVSVQITTNGNLGNHSPGIYVDGAHLYVKRAGSASFEQHHIPAEHSRNISTQNVFFHESWTDVYTAASDYDTLVTQEDEVASFAVLRRINPDIEIFIGESGTTCFDRRDSAGHDRLFPGAALTFLEAKTNHPEWLYTGGNGLDGYVNSKTYAERYWLQISNSAYQQLWAQKIIQTARKSDANGVWVDDCIALTIDHDGIDRKPCEVQQFMHAVYPQLKAAGLKVIQNGCGQHLDGSNDGVGNNGRMYFYPFWIPDTQFPESTGYSANTPENVPDVFFQEYAFIKPNTDKNVYDKTYWLACINDMDAIAEWNTETGSDGNPKLRDDQKRLIHLLVLGRDFSDDPAYGIDGWIHFGMCSYLLAQNNWTSFGCRVEGSNPGVNSVPYPNIDLSITKKLGTPDGRHWANVGDAYCRWRRYKPTDDGGVGGLVVVNANSTATRTYRIDIDATDESGNIVTSGTKIKLPPHTGRIFLQRQLLDVSLSVLDENVYSGQTVDINVEYHNKSSSAVTNVSVQVQVPEQMTYVTGSAEKSGGRYYPETNTVVWTVSSVIPNGTGTRTFRATVK